MAMAMVVAIAITAGARTVGANVATVHVGRVMTGTMEGTGTTT